jgi:hypothetical protein
VVCRCCRALKLFVFLRTDVCKFGWFCLMYLLLTSFSLLDLLFIRISTIFVVIFSTSVLLTEIQSQVCVYELISTNFPTSAKVLRKSSWRSTLSVKHRDNFTFTYTNFTCAAILSNGPRTVIFIATVVIAINPIQSLKSCILWNIR